MVSAAHSQITQSSSDESMSLCHLRLPLGGWALGPRTAHLCNASGRFLDEAILPDPITGTTYTVLLYTGLSGQYMLNM